MAQERSTSADLKKQACFVVGPIGKDGSAERKHADLLLNAVIKHVLEQNEFNYNVKRADEDSDPGMIGDRVISDIINSALVVADLTDLNPNAFYELGIRHSALKPTIHIAKLGTPLPFDNLAHRTIFVDLGDWGSIQNARGRLADSARAIRSPDYKVSNPITQADSSFKMSQSDDPRDRVLAEVQERLGSMEKDLASSRIDTKMVDDTVSSLIDYAVGLHRNAVNDREIRRRSLLKARALGLEVDQLTIKNGSIDFWVGHRRFWASLAQDRHAD